MVYFRPKTLHSAYLLANLQEATNELIEKKSNATTPMSSSSKINLSKEVEKVNSELVGYHECCKANEKSEEIECMGLIALDNICEENVEGVDMEWDDNNKCLVVMNKVWNEETFCIQCVWVERTLMLDTYGSGRDVGWLNDGKRIDVDLGRGREGSWRCGEGIEIGGVEGIPTLVGCEL
ncbi:hypothetical protein Tco_1379972 [Tanacetum coccineum]